MATYYQDYTIFFRDTDEWAAAVSAAGGTQILDSPTDAAVTYGVTSANINPAAVPPTSKYILTGTITSLLPVNQDSAAVPADFFYAPDNPGGLFASPGSPAGTIFWRGFLLVAGTAGTSPTKEALQTHRWMVGFEHPFLGEGLSTGASTQRQMRDASRTLEGMGLALRSPANETVTMTMPSAGAGFPTKDSWERVYVRLRRYPSANEAIWGAKGSIEAGTAVLLLVSPTGQLLVNNKGNQAFPGTNIIAAGQIPLNQWTRIDLLFSFARNGSGGSGDGGVILCVNGNFIARAAGNGPPGPTIGGAGGLFNVIQTHSQSYLGNENTPTNSLDIDYDDWTNKTQPLLFTGDDWSYGSHIQPLTITGFGPGHSGSWTGAYQTLDALPVNGQQDSVDSAVASISMEVTTDYKDRQIGCSGLVLSLFHKTASGTVESLGYSINGGAFVMQNVTASTGTWAVPSPSTGTPAILYSAGGNRTAPQLTSVNLKYTRDGAATNRQVQALQASAEYLGFFTSANCDPGPAGTVPPLIPFPFMHNTPYADDMFGIVGGVGGGEGVVEVMGGTYTGNGTAQDVVTKMPAHWIWIRPTSVVGTGGSRWWSTCLAGHDPLIETPNKGNLVRAYNTDITAGPTGYKFRVSGSNANSNQNGVTYQWIAFSDRMMRFCLNGSYLTLSGAASVTENLLIGTFTPLAGFLLPEIGTVAATTGLYYKGPGHVANAASIMDSAESATVCSFGTGSIASKTIINLASANMAYSLWRQSDGAGNIGGVAIATYTGDGTGARTISLTGLNGKSPMFVIVQPHNGVAYVKDPSHGSTNSTPINTSVNVGTAITGGAAGQISVGATLNAGGIVYDVFALPGAAAFTNPTDPFCPLPPVLPPDLPGPSVNGWWTSTNLFTGASGLTFYPPTNPHDARDWTKINIFATGNAAFYAGFPPPGVTLLNRFFIYAGNDYQVGGTQPTIRIFDGTSDRLMITVPDNAGVKTLAIMGMIINGGQIYFTTLDGGSSGSTYTGRVFQFDPNALKLTQLGSQFTGGECPYALCWHMGRLFMGTNKGDGSAAKIYWFRPGQDTAWTQDYTLTTSGVGGCTSLASFQGKLYVGCNATAAMGTNKIVVRDTVGAYTTAFTLTTAGTFRASNGCPAMVVFNGNLYVSYWNPDTTPDSYVKKFDGSTWSTAYTGTGTTLRPFTGLFVSKNTMFIVGGGSGLTACLLSSTDGAVWTDLTAFLSGTQSTVTAMPIVGQIGV
jgi:hypothetical protein